MIQRWDKSISSSPDLWEDFKEMTVFDWTFTISERSAFEASGHIDVEHRGLYGTSSSAIMVSLQLQMNGGWLTGSKTGANIVGTRDHYQALQLHGYIELGPGNHTVTLWMRSASTAAPGKNGLAQIKPNNYNHVVYKVTTI
jgi:hypothetical protein